MFIAIQPDDSRPIYQQIVQAVKEEIRQGRLANGEELPGVRELAAALGVNLHTCHRAYQVLRQEGVIQLRLGRRARVAPVRRQPANPKEARKLVLSRLEELATHAYHLGMGAHEFRRLVDKALAPGGEDRKDDR